MKTPDTKTILNVSLMIGIFFIGKKLFEFFGVTKNQEDKIAEALDEGSTSNIINITPTAPVGLSLNPNYWKSIIRAYNNGLIAKGKPKLTGSEIIKVLRFAPDLPNAKITLTGLIYSSPLASVKLSQLIELQKKRPTTQFENTYLFLAWKIKEAKGLFVDNPEIVYDCFQQLLSKTQISYLANIFSLYYNQDLTSYLNDFLDSGEMTKIYNIIKNKKLV